MSSNSPTMAGETPAARILLLPRGFRLMTVRCCANGWPLTWSCPSPIRRHCWSEPTGVELDGQRRWAADSSYWLPRDRAAAVGMRHATGNDLQGLGEFESGEMGTEAVVHATAERQHRRGTLAGDVETIGFVVHCRVAVGSGRVGDDDGAGWDADVAEFDVLGGDTDGIENDWEVAHDLLDC